MHPRCNVFTCLHSHIVHSRGPQSSYSSADKVGVEFRRFTSLLKSGWISTFNRESRPVLWWPDPHSQCVDEQSINHVVLHLTEPPNPQISHRYRACAARLSPVSLRDRRSNHCSQSHIKEFTSCRSVAPSHSRTQQLTRLRTHH